MSGKAGIFARAGSLVLSVAVPPGLLIIFAVGANAVFEIAYDVSWGAYQGPEFSWLFAPHGSLGVVSVALLTVVLAFIVLLGLGWRSWRARPPEDRRRAAMDGFGVGVSATLLAPIAAWLPVGRASGLGLLWVPLVPLLLVGWRNWHRRSPEQRHRGRLDGLWVIAVWALVVASASEAARLGAAARKSARQRDAAEFWETSAEGFADPELRGVPDDSETALLLRCGDCFVRDAGPADPVWLKALEARLAEGFIQYRQAFAPFYKPQLVTRGVKRGAVIRVLHTNNYSSGSTPVSTIFVPTLEGRYAFPGEATLLNQARTPYDWAHGFSESGWIELRTTSDGWVVVQLEASVVSKGDSWPRLPYIDPQVDTRVQWAPLATVPYKLIWKTRPPLDDTPYKISRTWTLKEAGEGDFISWAELLREETRRRGGSP